MALNTAEIGKRIAKIRKARHYTQDELDEIIDILNGYDADKMAILQRYMRLFVEISDFE
ncbi:MAG: hypothetical protein K6B14_07680 [Lachnospiraceae bacterium]|nr:hypothetical protein [Lachnospiraceae bacterium]